MKLCLFRDEPLHTESNSQNSRLTGFESILNQTIFIHHFYQSFPEMISEICLVYQIFSQINILIEGA